MISAELAIGIVLTALTYAGLMWAVVHGKHVVDRINRGEYPHHPNPEHRGDGSETGTGASRE